jgi:GntR family transcriptional repressor for pyruvate dehydrogenase complex
MDTFTGSAATELVVAYVRGLIDRGALKAGDRLPAERDLARTLRVSRPSLRAGLRSLAVMGVVATRAGAGSFIAAGPPELGTDALRFQAALHGFTREKMFEARLVLEVAVAGMAAEHAASEDLAAISHETTGMFATQDQPQVFLLHDIAFHRAVAAASANPVLSALVSMVSEIFREQRQRTIGQADDLRLAADEHRAIYLAIRAHDPPRARKAMTEHLARAGRTQAVEARAEAGPAAPASTDESRS